MAEEQEIFKQQDELLNYEKQSNKLQIDFENALKAKYSNYKYFQMISRTIFKEMDETEEINTFFETDQLQVLEDCKSLVLDHPKFQVQDNPNGIRELLDHVSQIAEGDQKNIEIDLKAIDNLLKIKEFFESLFKETDSIIKFFQEEEKGFSLEKEIPNYETQLKKAEAIITKMMKSLQKIKRTQITFTIEDTELSDFIENYNGDQLTTEDLSEEYKKCDAFFGDVIEAVGRLLEMNFEEVNEEADEGVRRLIKRYVKFFENENNSLNKYYLFCYIYREQAAEEILEEASLFINLILNKITAYRTMFFIKHYESEVKPRIINHIKGSQKLIDNLVDSDTAVDDFQLISKNINIAISLYNFANLNLTQKITKNTFFNNETINRKNKVLAVELKTFGDRLGSIKSHFPILDLISQEINNYKGNVNEVKSINFEDGSVDNLAKCSVLLRRLNHNKKSLENILIQFKSFNSKNLTQVRDLIDGNDNIIEEIKNILKKVDKQKKKKK